MVTQVSELQLSCCCPSCCQMLKHEQSATACGALSKRHQVLGGDILDATCARFLGVLSQATPQAVANLLYGLANMGAAPSEQLLVGCAEHLASITKHATAQNIANTIWAIGELGDCLSDDTLQALLQADALQVRLRPVQKQSILNISTCWHACRPLTHRSTGRSYADLLKCHTTLVQTTCRLLLRRLLPHVWRRRYAFIEHWLIHYTPLFMTCSTAG